MFVCVCERDREGSLCALSLTCCPAIPRNGGLMRANGYSQGPTSIFTGKLVVIATTCPSLPSVIE